MDSAMMSSHTNNDSFDIDEYLTFSEEEAIAILPTKRDSNSKNKIRSENGAGDQRGLRIAFRTKSECEIMDDGYKWRKYGKKMVKNSPNPRNYYRCVSEGCNVKKRAERERDDSSYVMTTYEGIHSHPCPSEQHNPSALESPSRY